MSLINQMLKDLEARQKSKPPSSPIGGLTSGFSARAKKPIVSKKFLLIAIPVFSVIIFGLLFVGGESPQPANELTPDIAAAKTPVKSPVADDDAPVVEKPPTLLIPPVADPAGVQLHIDNVVFTPDADGNAGKLIFTLKDNSQYYDFSLQENGTVASILFYNTIISRDILATLPANPFFGTITFDRKNTDTQLNVPINQGIEVVGLEMHENVYPPILTLTLRKSSGNATQAQPKSQSDSISAPAMASQPVNPPAADGSMTKVNVPPTQDQLAERLRMQAVQLSKEGKIFDALHLLSEGMAKYPNYKPIVETLASLLLEDRQLVAAQTILNKGLAQNPQHVPYVVLQAQLFATKGEAQAALDTLNSVSPTLEQSPDYFALMAGLQQRLGNSEIAEQIYQELVSLDPENGVWWMGYGIALEANGKRNNAIQAYKRAANTGNLSSKLLMYSNSRIEALGG